MRKIIILWIIVLIATPLAFAGDVPYDVMEQIKENAENEYPDDYSMQNFTINRQVRAYIAIQNYSNNQIPYDVLENIMDNAAQEYPDDYGMQKFTIDRQVRAYVKIHKDD